MAALSVQVPYPVFYDRSGDPLENGYVWIGQANQNPQTNPINVYFDKELTQLVAQPLRTIAGYISNAGTPAQVYVDASNFSIIAQEKDGTMIYNFPNGTGISPSAAGITFTGFKGQIGNIEDLADGDGSDWIGFDQSYSAGVARSAQDKMRDVVSVKDFGAIGNGIADDTASIQAALDSGATLITMPAGIYLINGNLRLTTPNTTFNCTGATIKLRNNAPSLAMLNVTGQNCTVDGGIWDGNKAGGNTGSSTFASYGVGLFADNCTAKNITSINTFGIGIKGFGNYLTVLNCNIKNTGNYGIFFDGSTSVSNYGNKAIGNTIDMSDGIITTQNQGQGILFTAGTGQNQIDWEISDNNIIGPTASVGDQAINIAVRGKNGIVSNNTTRYGSIGFSEGRDDTIITGNRFLDLVGGTRYGIEPTGQRVTITGNVISNALRGIIVSGNITYDFLTITGNTIFSQDIGILLQINSGFTGHNITISGNTINATNNAVYTRGSVDNLLISGNSLSGPGISSGRGVFVATPNLAAYVSIIGNVFSNWQRAMTIYSLTSNTYSDLYAINNIMAKGLNTAGAFWNAEGLAVIGANVTTAYSVTAYGGVRYNLLDQQNQTRIVFGNGSPEGVVTAGVGSLYLRQNGGAGTSLYVKQSGTGNTGWAAK